jgi:type 1 glutamine amidotransferase
MDYPGHLWRETWPVLAGALRKDPRLEVTTIEDPHFLDSAALERYDAAVMHWQNWEQPGPGSEARANLKRFVEQGGGVALVHFACGAWHGEWEGYVEVAGRVWFGTGPGKMQHDPYGPFTVQISQKKHPVTEGMGDFETTDELYTCLEGEHPIEVLAEAESKVTGKLHPMAFVSRLGEGRTFHCTLGHDVQALRVPEVQKLYRRGIAWIAGLDPGR